MSMQESLHDEESEDGERQTADEAQKEVGRYRPAANSEIYLEEGFIEPPDEMRQMVDEHGDNGNQLEPTATQHSPGANIDWVVIHLWWEIP